MGNMWDVMDRGYDKHNRGLLARQRRESQARQAPLRVREAQSSLHKN